MEAEYVKDAENLIKNILIHQEQEALLLKRLKELDEMIN